MDLKIATNSHCHVTHYEGQAAEIIKDFHFIIMPIIPLINKLRNARREHKNLAETVRHKIQYKCTKANKYNDIIISRDVYVLYLTTVINILL